MDPADEKVAVARLSVWSNSSLVVLKVVTGILMGSVSVLSEAIHSAIDLIAALVARYSVKRAAEPADSDHTYGHGKFENLSGVFEGALIFVAAAAIIYESSKRLLHLEGVEFVGAGMAVMGVSAVVNILVSRRLLEVARRTDSLALEADACHLKTDVWTSAGVFFALGVIYFTGWDIVDPVVALLVAAIIIRAAYDITKRSADGLLDKSLPDEEMRAVLRVMERYRDKMLDFHRLRARKMGSDRQLDVHVTVPSSMSVKDSHEMVEGLEAAIREELPSSTIVVHVEPCDAECERCRLRDELLPEDKRVFDGRRKER